MIDSMLKDRSYTVTDFGTTSEQHPQSSGISQGCTLSPLLFVTAMSVLLSDALQQLSPAAVAKYRQGDLADLVYADDALLIGVQDQYLQEYLDAVYRAGQMYGMELHFGKFQMVSTDGRSAELRTPDGKVIPTKSSMEYLGAVLHSDGCGDHEVTRRIAISTADFEALAVVWSRSALTWKQKVRVFESLVESKLLYSLVSMTMTKAQRKRLDAFQNRCLRKIVGIAPSFYSRVSNASVLATAGCKPISEILRLRRLQQYGKLSRASSDNPIKFVCFIPGSTRPATDRYVRRVGRPAKEWVKEVQQDISSLFGSLHAATALMGSKCQWNAAVKNKLGFAG